MTRKHASSFVALFHHRWAVPILATLHRSSGCKFVTLVNRLCVSRDSLRRTLAALIRQGWVRRNPGHGHPLRPEYVLTRSGVRLAPWCHRLLAVLSSFKGDRMGLRKWSMAVVYALREGRARFSAVRSALPEATARALTMALKDLQAAGVVDRLVSDGYPPATYYRLTARGRRLTPLLGKL